MSCSIFSGGCGGWGAGTLNWKVMMEQQVKSQVHVLGHARLNVTTPVYQDE